MEPSHYPYFSSPGAVGRAAYDIGFRLFGTSNNHIYDKGTAGIAATLRFWEGMPEDALAFGLWENGDEMEIPLYEENGITFACLAYTQYTNGIPTPADSPAHVILTSETDLIEAQIKKARTLADVVLVSVHWGTEDSHTVTDGQKLLAQQMADWVRISSSAPIPMCCNLRSGWIVRMVGTALSLFTGQFCLCAEQSRIS